MMLDSYLQFLFLLVSVNVIQTILQMLLLHIFAFKDLFPLPEFSGSTQPCELYFVFFQIPPGACEMLHQRHSTHYFYGVCSITGLSVIKFAFLS